jgi:alkylglycerol monooxygenase
MNLSPVTLSIPIFIILIIIELSYEWYSGKHTYRFKDAITNILAGVLQQILKLVLKIGAYTYVFKLFHFIDIPVNWATGLLLVFLYDFCYYWRHRMAHEVSLFWGAHVVHHQSEDFNLSVALRQSSTAFLWSFPFYLPLALIGFDPMQMAFIAGINLIYQFWIHTEHINRMPNWFEAIMNSPAHHRVHHGKDPKYIDKNHAGMFIIWDKLFGTFQEEEEKANYGVTVPAATWNPVYANFKHYIYLFKTVFKTRSISDGLKVLFFKPGWQPEYLGGSIEPQEVDPNYEKFNHGVSGWKAQTYVTINFILLLVITTIVLFTFKSMDSIIAGISIVWVVWTCLMIGVILEAKNHFMIKLAEFIRIGCLIVLFFYI